MSHIAFLNDLHFGWNGSSKIFEDEIEIFLNDVFFPHIDAGECRAVFVAGDIFHDRRAVNVKSLNFAKTVLFDELEKRKIPTFVSLGNHDTFFKNKLTPNSVAPILGEYQFVKLVDKPTDVTVSDKHFLVIPWICADNEEEVMKEVRMSHARFLVGHLELAGATLENGRTSKGMAISDFAKFEKVFSGHYHGRTSYANILYMGTQYHMNRGDVGVTKGFSVMDSNGDDYFIRNPRKLFLEWTFSNDKHEGWDPVEAFMSHEEELDGRIVTFKFDDTCTIEGVERIISLIEKSNVYSYKIVDVAREKIASKDIEIRAKSTMDLISDYVDENYRDTDFNPSMMKSILEAAYQEATGVAGNE